MADPVFISLSQFPRLGDAMRGQNLSINLKAKIIDVSDENGNLVAALDISELGMETLENLSTQQIVQLQNIERNTGAVNTPVP